MAFQMVHLEIAYKLAEKLEIREGREEFILGSVAPDSAPVIEPDKKEKVHSHLFENCGPWGDTQDYDNWIANIKTFWERYGKKENDVRLRMFLLGICVHCYTDYWNDLLIWRDLQKKMLPVMSLERFRAEYYPEAQIVDKWLYQNSPDAEEIFRLLGASKEYDFEGFVFAKDLEHLKYHLIYEQYNIPEKIDVSGYKYYPSEKVWWFVDTVTDRIYKQLKD